jgi:hypothetical protein
MTAAKAVQQQYSRSTHKQCWSSTTAEQQQNNSRTTAAVQADYIESSTIGACSRQQQTKINCTYFLRFGSVLVSHEWLASREPSNEAI